MQDTFKALKDKYAHLEFSILPLSSALKDNETKRLDSEYFKKEYLENEEAIKSQFQIKNFTNTRIQNIKSLYLNKNFHYLQISDIDTSNGLEFSTTQIDFTDIPDRATYTLHKGDICVSTVRPNRNAVALINHSKRLVGTSGFCILRIKDKTKLAPEVLYIFCKTNFFITKMMRANTASLYPAVIDSDVLKCQIPLFDSSFQADIEKIVKDSHHKLEQSKSLYKEAESLLYESLGIANSSLGNHCVDLANFECSQTPSLASHSKFAKNSTSTSASRRLDERSEVPNTRILVESQGDSAKDSNDSMESTAKSLESSLRGSEATEACVASATHPHLQIHKINPHEVRTLKGVVGGGERLRGEGSDFAIKAPSPLAEKATKDSKNLTESRRSERVESHIESFRESAESTAELESLTFSSDSSTLQNAQPKARQTHTTEALKLTFPHLNFSIKPLSLSLQKSGRLDSEYYQSKYENIEALIKSRLCRRLGDLVSIKKSIEPGSEAYQSEGIEFVRVSNLSKFGISKSDIYLSKEKFGKDLAKIAPQKETILLSKDGSVGISYCVEENLDCITSGAILHLRVKDKKQILPQVLSLILNSITTQLQAERDSGGSIIAHWKISEIENILIPLLDSQIQEQIASKLKLSFALKKEAKELLNLAKNKVEQAIESKIS